MKKSIIYSVLIVFIFAGCGLEELTKFHLDYESKFTIPATTTPSTPVEFTIPNIATNSDSTFNENNTAADLVESITLAEMTVSAVDTSAAANLDFLKDVEVYISSGTLDKKLIASGYELPNDGSKTISLNTENTNLKPYLTAAKFKLHIKVVADQPINTDTEVKVFQDYLVDAQILGL